jgi:hypothetical protein
MVRRLLEMLHDRCCRPVLAIAGSVSLHDDRAVRST